MPVERLWPGETFALIASGPSLIPADVDYVRGKARVIVINNNYQLAPWADALYACDARWWQWHRDALAQSGFRGLRFSLDAPGGQRPDDVHILRKTGADGLEHDPSGLRHGHNSGYQAINLAVHLGAAKIILLGYDLKRTGGKSHWHADHPTRQNPNYTGWVQHFATLVKPLNKLGIAIVNCTIETALECFPRAALRDVLPNRGEVAA